MSRRSLLIFALASTAALAGCSSRAAVPRTPRHQVEPGRAAIDRTALREKLAARRQITFQRFLAYREARRYPLSPGPGRQHIWVDYRGYLCAAATMISGDWGREVTIAAVGANRAIKLADVNTGPIADWMLTSGLIQQELVAIQVPGFEGGEGWEPRTTEAPEVALMYPLYIEVEAPEVALMYPLYIEVERQITSQWDANLELAVDRLLAHPALARAFLIDRLPTGRAAG